MKRLKAEWPERVLGMVLGFSIILANVVLHHKSAGSKVCAAVAAAALVGEIVIVARRWWRQRKHPELRPPSDPNKPNYNRTPYV